MIRHDRLPPRPAPTPAAIAMAGAIADLARTVAPWGLQVGHASMAWLREWRRQLPRLGEWIRTQWDRLQEVGQDWLAPKPLAAATALPPTLFTAWLLQHGTPCFEWWPWLSDGGALLVSAMAGMVGVGAVARRGAKFPALTLAVGMALLASTELGILAARHRYQSERWASQPHQVPRQAVALPAAAVEVSLRAADGVSLRGSYFKGGHARAILLLPGWHGARNDFATTTLAQWLAHRYDVLALDLRGQGASGGSKSPELDEKADVLAALAFLHEEGHAKVALWAEEEAGWPAVAAAALKPGVDAVAWAGPSPTWGGHLDRDGLLGTPAGVVKRWGSRATMGLRLSGGSAPADPKELIRLVAPTPMLLVAGESRGGDGLAALHAAAQEPKALILLGNPGRSPTWDRYASYHQEVGRWLDLVMPSGMAVPPAPKDLSSQAQGVAPASLAPGASVSAEPRGSVGSPPSQARGLTLPGQATPQFRAPVPQPLHPAASGQRVLAPASVSWPPKASGAVAQTRGPLPLDALPPRLPPGAPLAPQP